MIEKRNNCKEEPKGMKLLMLVTAIIMLTISGNLTASMIAAQWQIIDFVDHGTRRIVEIDDNRWFFYRSEPNAELTLDVPEGKMMIKTAVRQDIDEITYQVRIGNAFRNFTTSGVKTSGEFTVMDDVYLNLGPGVHRVSISTPNRLAYFKVFLEEEVWAVPTVREAFVPDSYEKAYSLKSDDTESPYFSASNTAPLEFMSIGPNEVTGFARFLINNDRDEGIFDIVVNNRTIDTVTIPPRKTGSFWLVEKPEQDLSIGRRIEFELPAGEHRVQIIPRSDYTFIFRFIMDIPEEIPLIEDPVYELNAFEEITFTQKALTGLQITLGTSLRFSNNVFSLSEHDLQRFDEGDDRFDFIKTTDDLIINPSLRIRYPIGSGNFTVEPYLNANYYQYVSNTDKTNYGVLTGLFNSYKNFNLNLYYGYYADIYVRNYFTETANPATDQKFEYDRNLYRLYSYFRLGRYETPQLYFQIEDYYHNEHFTSYDGRATTYGVGWRRSFPTFFLRAFFYYRLFEGSNITATDDPSYESNIYEIQFRNKRIELSGDYDFRPYFGFRYENRFFTREYNVDLTDLTDYQSSRNDRRYRFNFGSEFYLSENLDLILEYVYFLRDSTSEVNRNVARDKDYTEQSISIGFEYTFNF